MFAATPPLEAKKMLLSDAVTPGIGHLPGEKEGTKLDFTTISRAYFQADAIREVYVELPAEDREEGMCGRLKESMHGTRDVAQNWGEDCSRFMVESGFVRGRSSPRVFRHPDREIRCVVHGDDFWEAQPDWFWERARTNPSPSIGADLDQGEMTANRFVY